jgi:hypothetical protein
MNDTFIPGGPLGRNAPREQTQGRLDILIHRLSAELANRFHASTGVDIRDSMREVTEQAIDDMGIPRTSIDANAVVRSLFKVPDRSRNPRKPRLRRVS